MLANTAVSSPSSTIRTRPSTKFSDSLRNRSTCESPSRTSIAGVQPAVFRSPVIASTWARAPEVSRSSNTIRRSPEMESMMPANSALLPRKLSAKPFIMAGPKFRLTLGVVPMAAAIGFRSTRPISPDWANAVEASSRVENRAVRIAFFIAVSPFMVVGWLVVWLFGWPARQKPTRRWRRGLSGAVGPLEVRPNVSGVRQLGQAQVGHDEALLDFTPGLRRGALAGAIDGIERELQFGQVAGRRRDDGRRRRPRRRLQHHGHDHGRHQRRGDAQQPGTALLHVRIAPQPRLDCDRKFSGAQADQFAFQRPVGGQLGLARDGSAVFQRIFALEITFERIRRLVHRIPPRDGAAAGGALGTCRP